MYPSFIDFAGHGIPHLSIDSLPYPYPSSGSRSVDPCSLLEILYDKLRGSGNVVVYSPTIQVGRKGIVR